MASRRANTTAKSTERQWGHSKVVCARLAPLFLLSFLFTLPAFGQEEECKACNAGRVICRDKNHDAKRVCGGLEKHLCTPCLRSACCRGLGWRPCGRCSHPEAAKTFRLEQSRRREWLQSMRNEVDVRAGVRYAHVETDHFIVHSCFPEWRFEKIGKRDREGCAHEFARRLERLAAKFEEVMGELPDTKPAVYIQWDADEQFRLTTSLSGNGIRTSTRLFVDGRQAFFCLPSYESLYTDRGLHSHLIHHGAHLLFGSLARPGSPSQWLDAGVAHWFERDAFGGKKHCNSFCSERVSTKSRWAMKSGWAKLLRKDLGRRQFHDLQEIAAMRASELTAREHAWCWAWASFAIESGKNKGRWKTWSRGRQGQEAMLKDLDIEDPERRQAAIRRHIRRLR